MVLGGIDGVRYKPFEIALAPGDRLILYTDGVTEANNDYHGFYGEGRLAAKAAELRNADVAAEVQSIVDDVLGFTGDSEQFDDITLFVLEYTGPE